MVIIKLSNEDFARIQKHLVTAYESYQEYSMDDKANDVQLLIGAIIINHDER